MRDMRECDSQMCESRTRRSRSAEAEIAKRESTSPKRRCSNSRIGWYDSQLVLLYVDSGTCDSDLSGRRDSAACTWSGTPAMQLREAQHPLARVACDASTAWLCKRYG